HFRCLVVDRHPPPMGAWARLLHLARPAFSAADPGIIVLPAGDRLALDGPGSRAPWRQDRGAGSALFEEGFAAEHERVRRLLHRVLRPLDPVFASRARLF